MLLRELPRYDQDLIGKCLACVASGDVIADDWEFPTLFGMTFAEFRSVAESWPNVDESREDVALAIWNSVGSLLGYPHGKDATVERRIGAPKSDLKHLLEKLRL